jgi:UDP-N-acetylmuramate--alanine ligase
MHIYFSGIGGTGIGPLALVAKQAGFRVSGSDKQPTQYIDYLRSAGIDTIHIGQDRAAIAAVHGTDPIDWFVYSSALPLENPNAPELLFCQEKSIKMSKRDELLNQILNDAQLSLLAVAGTHGKTTTTAMVVWLYTELHESISYILPAKTSFAAMGAFAADSRHFIYEADEFDRNFLAYHPDHSLITGVSWDHHEIFTTREDYQAAFRDFIHQSATTYLWQEDASYLKLEVAKDSGSLRLQDSNQPGINQITLKGRYTRLDAWLAVQAVAATTKQPIDRLIRLINDFPGLQRRMEPIAPNLYSDYAHTPEKIRGAISVATEMAAETDQSVIVIYEPLTNRRQHYMLDDYKDCFKGAAHVYWLPSYLAREDSSQAIIPPQELIAHLADPSLAEPAERNSALQKVIERHLTRGDMVVCMAGGGGDSLDEWLRRTFHTPLT